MKLTPDQIKLNMKVTQMELSETMNSDEFYEQFDKCPRCGKMSDSPLTECDDDRAYSFNMIQHRRCKKCLINWEYTRYVNIKDDPSYQDFMRIRHNPPPRPKIQGGPPPPPPPGFEPRMVREAGCMVWIIGGITATIILFGGYLL